MTITVGNDVNESSEIANINHTVTGTGSYDGLDVVAIKVTASDDDVVAGAAIRVDKTDVRLTEQDDDDGSAMVMVSLAVEPTDDVTVTVATSNDAVATVAGAPLTFTDSNWDDAQEITVTAVEDADPADAEATVTLTATGGGYGSAEKVEVDITVEDDEEATISVTDDFHDAEVCRRWHTYVHDHLVGPSGGGRDGSRKPAGAGVTRYGATGTGCVYVYYFGQRGRNNGFDVARLQ